VPWNLLILPLVGGYYILTRCYIFKFHQQRLEKQRLVFEAVLVGIGLMVFTYALRLVFNSVFSEWLLEIHTYSPFNQPFALTSLTSLALAIFGSEVFNKISGDVYWIKKSIKDVGNELENILKYSFEQESLLLITLNNDKVYIAWIKELPIPSKSPYVRVLPAISGFRSKEKRVTFTTHRSSVYSNYIEEGTIKYIDELNTDLILDISDIITVSNFDPKMYKEFQEQE